MELDALIESVLFWRAAPLTLGELGTALETTPEAVARGLDQLENKLRERGLTLVRKDDTVMIGTKPAAADLIKRLAREELSQELGRAGLETIAVVLYHGPVARSTIDYIRGVNSSFTLRHLQIRDLIEKIADPQDQRRLLYRPTLALLQHLGLSRLTDLPDYELLKKETAERLQSNDHQSA